MEDFDFSALLRKHQIQHKSKPAQFTGVANGVKKRLDSNIKRRKSSRLSIFDKIRNMPQLESPLPLTDKQQKIENRRIQLAKWKEEKEKKKKEARAQKKKPFLVGVAHAPARYIPPPPPRALPSTSGRVTRSQTSRNKASKQGATMNIVSDQSNAKSFAPANATFHPPEIKRADQISTLSLSKSQAKASMVKIEPVLPLDTNTTIKKPVVKSNVKLKVDSNKSKTIKQLGSSNSSSSVESEPMEPKKRAPKKYNEPISNKTQEKNLKKPELTPVENSVKTPRKSKDMMKKNSKISIISIASTSSETSLELPAIYKKSPRKLSEKEPDNLVQRNSTSVKRTPPKPIPRSESSSEERLRSPKTLEQVATEADLDSYVTLSHRKNNVHRERPQMIPKDQQLCKPESSEKKLRSPMSIDMPMTPEQIAAEAKRISPCVTVSRGKDNARREMLQKLALGLLDEDLSDIDSIDHFKNQLNSEMKRLTETCEIWDKISDQETLPQVVQEAVLGAVGQARLLITQKLQQFAGLVALCESPDPSHLPVTVADLHGFWDMVFMQVVNVDMRFKKLEEMKARGWAAEEQPAVTQRTRKALPKQKAARAAPPATSRIRDMISAARKAKKERSQEARERESQASREEDSKTFEAGFFSVRSPVRCSPLSTPNKPTLLKAVLSSEAQKASSASKNSVSLAMLRASMIGKSVEQDYTANEQENLIQFTPVNIHATPGRSILKCASAQSKKPLKCVLFDSSDADILDNSIDKDISGIRRLDTELSMGRGKENENLGRQDVADRQSPIMTRNRRKQTPNKGEQEILQESDLNTPSRPRRSTRKKSVVP